jgi:hypothetical protein
MRTLLLGFLMMMMTMGATTVVDAVQTPDPAWRPYTYDPDLEWPFSVAKKQICWTPAPGALTDPTNPNVPREMIRYNSGWCLDGGLNAYCGSGCGERVELKRPPGIPPVEGVDVFTAGRAGFCLAHAWQIQDSGGNCTIIRANDPIVDTHKGLQYERDQLAEFLEALPMPVWVTVYEKHSIDRKTVAAFMWQQVLDRQVRF